MLKVKYIESECTNVSIKTVGVGEQVSGKGTIKREQRPIPYLEPNESTSFTLPLSLIGLERPVESADVTVKIVYRPLLLPFKKEKLARFITEKGSDGTLHWANKAISE